MALIKLVDLPRCIASSNRMIDIIELIGIINKNTSYADLLKTKAIINICLNYSLREHTEYKGEKTW